MSLVQTQCPFCKATVYAYQPGCFQCRQGIPWPPPQDQAQAAMQQAATAWFQQAMAQWQAQQAQQQQHAPQPPQQQQQQQQQQAPRPAAAAPTDASMAGLVESTAFDAVTYDPQTAEDVEGLLPSSFAEFVPRDIPVQRTEDFQPTAQQQEGPAAGFTGMTAADGLEATSVGAVGAVPDEKMPDQENGNYAAITASAPPDQSAAGDAPLEATALDGGIQAIRRVKKAASAEGARMCTDCGTRSDKLLCPSCGARTREGKFA